MTADSEVARISELSADALSDDALDGEAASAFADATDSVAALLDASDVAASSLLAAAELADAFSEVALVEDDDPDDPQAHKHADSERTADKNAMVSNLLMKTPSLGLS